MLLVVTAAAAAAAMVSGEGMFATPIMGRVACVALPVPRLVCLEVVELMRLGPSFQHSLL